MVFHCQIARRFLPGMILWDHSCREAGKRSLCTLYWVTEEALGPSERYGLRG